MRKPEQRRLFDIKEPTDNKPKPRKRTTSNPEPKKTEETKPKRGRPKKQEVPKQPEVAPKKKQKPTEPDVEWKDFNKSKPDPHIPCNFKIETGKKIHTFRGYIEKAGITCIDDPYAMTVLRKKHGNIFYSEIYECTVEDCPDGFPMCEICKKRKNK